MPLVIVNEVPENTVVNPDVTNAAELKVVFCTSPSSTIQEDPKKVPEVVPLELNVSLDIVQPEVMPLLANSVAGMINWPFAP